MTKSWNEIKIGDRIKCVFPGHSMYRLTGSIKAKNDYGSTKEVRINWDNSYSDNICYFGCFEIIELPLDILNGGQEV
jgi:hypothetical protein